MKKKLISIFIILALLISLTTPSFAYNCCSDPLIYYDTCSGIYAGEYYTDCINFYAPFCVVREVWVVSNAHCHNCGFEQTDYNVTHIHEEHHHPDCDYGDIYYCS